jgi:hypothetical protein
MGRPTVNVPALVNLLSEWTRLHESDTSYVDRHGMASSLASFEQHPLCEIEMVLENYSPALGYSWGYAVHEHSRDGLGPVPRLYRGCAPDRKNGMSWTHQRDIAEGFARQRGGNVYTATFQPGDVLMVVHIRHDGLHRMNPGEQDRKPFTEWIVRPNGKAQID